MMAMLWSPDRRRQMERPLFDLYRAALLDNGVSGYDHQALDEAGPGRGLSSVGALVDHKTSVEVAWIVKTP